LDPWTRVVIEFEIEGSYEVEFVDDVPPDI
jgi:hypothetical protein